MCCRQETYLHRLRIILLLVPLILLALISQKMIINNRHDHFLKADPAMNEIKPAAIHFNSYIFLRRKSIILGCSAQKLNLLQIIGIRILHHDGIASAVLHNTIDKSGLVDFVILGQWTIGIEETMICGKQNMRCPEIITDDLRQVLQFLYCVIAGREHHRIGCMACLINSIMIDIHNIHSLYHCASVSPLRIYQIFIFYCHAVRLLRLQDPIPVSGIR